MRVEDRVAGVAYPREGWAGDAHCGRFLGDFAGRDLKAVGFDLDTAKSQLVEEAVGPWKARNRARQSAPKAESLLQGAKQRMWSRRGCLA